MNAVASPRVEPLLHPAVPLGRPQAEPLDVFILGTAYSGSTLLANALNAHSAVASVGELTACFPDFPLGHREPFCPLCAATHVTCPHRTNS